MSYSMSRLRSALPLFAMLLISGQACAADKPNIVIVLADDLGWADVGFNVSDRYPTPNLDRLAQSGVTFERFYPGAANCAPSRATILTGTYTSRTRVFTPQGYSGKGDFEEMRFVTPTTDRPETHTAFDVSVNNVEPRFHSIAEVLNPAGYTTARFGKWHIGDDNQGFDVSSAAGEPGVITNIDGEETRYYDDVDVADRLTDGAIDFMRKSRARGRPFFLYLSHWEVHGPMAARADRVRHFESFFESRGDQDLNAVYAAEIERIDESVGRIMDFLAEAGALEDTVIIFSSDNGAVSDRSSNEPLRGGKGTFYEGGIRTPLVISWPQVVMTPFRVAEPVHGVDLLPTIADLAGAGLPEAHPVDGVSVVPLIRGSSESLERPLFFHFPLYLGNGGSDRVLPTYRGHPDYWRAVPLTVVMDDGWKLIYYYEYERFELFNLRDDPGESRDLAACEPDLVMRLKQRMDEWLIDVDAPIPRIANTAKSE